MSFVYIKIKKYKEYPDRSYLQVVESYREEGKVRNRTVFNFGRIDKGDALDRVNSLLKILIPYSNQGFDQINMQEDLTPIATKQIGPLLVFQKLWKELKLDKVLQESFEDLNTLFDLEKAIFNLVLNRLVTIACLAGLAKMLIQKSFMPMG